MTQVRSGKTRLLSFGGGGVILASWGLALAGEYDAMVAWWMTIALLLPPLLWAFKTRYVALTVICSISFATQFITLPFFYLYRDDFQWWRVKPFGFTAWEAFPMLSKVSLFLFALVIFFKWLYPVSLVGGSLRKRTATLLHKSLPTVSDRRHQYVNIDLKRHRKSWLFLLCIILIIPALVTVNLWMYSHGIGIVGTEPPRLPYRLSGILHYFTHFISPLLLGILYWKTKRTFFPMLFLLAYAWVLGMSSASRSGLVLVMLPVLTLAWMDRRWLMLCVAGLGTVVGFAFVTLERKYIYIVALGKASAVTSTGFFDIIFEIISDPESRVRSYGYFFQVLVGVVSRIEGFGNLVMSQYYNPDAVIGASGFILRLIYRGLAPLDLDLHHIQWQGSVLPEGFVNVGALLSSVVIVGNAGLWWVVISAWVVAVILVMLEKSVTRLVMRYKVQRLLGTAVLGFMCITYFIDAGSSKVFAYPFVILFALSFLPPLFRLGGQRRSKPRVVGSPEVAMPRKA